MNTTKVKFAAFTDRNGEAYFCPMDAGRIQNPTAGVDTEECVEASTAGRYAGNIDVVDRFGA